MGETFLQYVSYFNNMPQFYLYQSKLQNNCAQSKLQYKNTFIKYFNQNIYFPKSPESIGSHLPQKPNFSPKPNVDI